LAICENFCSSKGARPNGNTPMQTDPGTHTAIVKTVDQSINQSILTENDEAATKCIMDLSKVLVVTM